MLGDALKQARAARLTLLEVMSEAIDGPDEMAPNAPRVITVKVPVVGGQIEGLVLQMVEAIVSGDGNALNEILSGN